MKNNEEIFDLFRENEHKLDAPPSPMAWDKLERKLDNKKSAKRKVIWNYYAAAAGILLLVFAGFFYLKDNSNNQNQNITYAQAETSDLVEEEAKPARPILMSHKEKQFYYNNEPIANNNGYNDNVNKSPIAQAKIQKNRNNQLTPTLKTEIDKERDLDPDIALEKSKTKFAPKKPINPYTNKPTYITDSNGSSEDQMGDVEKAKSDDAYDGYTNSNNPADPEVKVPSTVTTTSAPGSAMPPPPIMQTQDSKVVEEDLVSEMAEEQLARSESIQIETKAAGKKSERKKRKKESYSAPSPSSASSPTIVTASPEMDDMEEREESSTFDEAESYKDIALGNAVHAKPKAKASEESIPPSQNYEISQLDWMSGEWTNQEDNTKEVWNNVSPSQLIGTIFSLGSDNQLYESDLIQIKRSRGKIILIQQNEVYDLVEISGKKAIFRSQEDRKSTIKITQSGSKLKIVNQGSNNSKTKVLKKE